MFLPGKDFQGSKLKVSLARKKGPMNSMRGGMPPREQRGMPPPLRGGKAQPQPGAWPSCALSSGPGRGPLGFTDPSLQALGDPAAPEVLAARAAPWAGWGAEAETGAASPPEDRGDPGETPRVAASSTALATGSVPTREYPLLSPV